MLHLRRYFAALAVLSLLCGTYWLAAAPWVEPPPLLGPKQVAAATPVVPSPHIQEELRQLFPAGSWELDPATKVVETDQCTLLIQDYLPTPDGHLKLNPCTLVFAAKGTAGSRKPIVLQAPGGADLKFDKALDLTKATFGRIVSGKLMGEIRIFSPPSSPTSRDSLLLSTHGVDLNREQIVTSYPVEFQYGDSRGRGQGLEIKLRQPEVGPDGKKKKTGLMGGMESLQLHKLEYLRIETEGPGLLGDALAGQPSKAARSEPLEIKCQGIFRFDFLTQEAMFHDHVEVLRVLPGAPADKLTCEELLLTFLLRPPAAALQTPSAATPATPPAATSPAATPPAAKPADPLAGRLQRILARGNPAVLEAPTSGISARAAWMEYELAQKRITLRPDMRAKPEEQQVTLRQLEQHFTARELQYELAPAGKLGRMWAAGPGEIKLLQGRGPARQTITARWEKELWVRPQDGSQVISLISRASVVADPLGRFDADELHLWVLEVPAEPPAAPAAAAATPPPEPQPANRPLAETPPAAPAKPAEKQPRTTLVPLRLWAKGHVQLVSPKLDAQTNDLQAWFMNLPPAPTEKPAPSAPPPLREPIAQAAFQQNALPQNALLQNGQPSAAIRNVIRPPSLQKFRAVGDKMQMQLVVQGREFDLDDLIIERQATIDETRTPEPGQEPIHVAGDLVKLRHGTTPEATIDVSGQPAEVAGRGMWLAAGTIHVHRGENRVWIDGPGEATLPVPADNSLAILPGETPKPPATNPALTLQIAPPPAKPQKLHLVWQQSLNFDGALVTILGDVQARTKTQTAAAPRLEALLSKRIDLLAPAGKERPELARLRLSDGVYVTNRSENLLGEQISFDQLQAPNLTIDRQAGKLWADGPGWVNSVRRTASLPGVPGSLPGVPGSLPGAPGAAAGPAPPQPPIQPPGSPPAAGGQPALISIHIEYEHGIEGFLDKRQIEFQRNVRTTYSPANDFADRIAIVTAADMTDKAMLMTSDKLTVTEMVTPVQRWFEMKATGHTILEGQKITANTPGSIAYTSATEWATITGDGRAEARIYLRNAPGEQVSPQSVQRARYNLRSGEFDGDLNRLEFFIPSRQKPAGRQP